ncbi:MAG TPA: hypothetical protein VNL69_09645 [Bacteroidota bacterium]|nr:hypothetical protein [Bacteroidota bacterium]
MNESTENPLQSHRVLVQVNRMIEHDMEVGTVAIIDILSITADAAEVLVKETAVTVKLTRQAERLMA